MVSFPWGHEIPHATSPGLKH